MLSFLRLWTLPIDKACLLTSLSVRASRSVICNRSQRLVPYVEATCREQYMVLSNERLMSEVGSECRLIGYDIDSIRFLYYEGSLQGTMHRLI